MHSSRQKVPIRYNGLLLPHQNCPLRKRGCRIPSNVWFLRPTRMHSANDISIDSAVFAWVTIASDRPADMQTGHATPAVTIGRIDIVLRYGLIIPMLMFKPRLHDTTGCQTVFVKPV